jgi:hypothetical protein
VNRVVMVLFFCTSFLTVVRANEVLNRKVNLRFAATPVHEALVQISQQAAFDLAYNTRIIPKELTTTIALEKATVREALYLILGTAYEYKSKGNSLIIKKAKSPSNEMIGFLKDPETGKRIAGATVYDKKSLRATTTDENGYYRLKIPKEATIAIEALAVCDTVLYVNSTTPRFMELNLTCQPMEPQPKPEPEPDLKLQLLRAEYRLRKFFQVQLEKWQTTKLKEGIERPAQISLAPRIGTNHTLDHRVTNAVSINLTAGHARGVRLFEIGGIGNFTEQRVSGLQVGAVFNINKGNTTGVQIGGVFSTTNQRLAGSQINGVFSLARDGAKSASQISGIASVIKTGNAAAQISGVYNQVPHLKGTQISGFANDAEHVQGAQIGGVFNLAKESKGLQIAALFSKSDLLHGVQINGAFSLARASKSGSTQIGVIGNLSEKGTSSVQIGGLLNLADTLSGTQIAVLANHAKHVRGFQIAFFNSADTCNCLQIGFVNRVGRRWLPIANAGRKKKSF